MKRFLQEECITFIVNPVAESLLLLKKVLTKVKSYFIINHVVTDAEIAQLVEHNLAKVGVASSSLVFRSMRIRPGCTSRDFLFYRTG